MCLGVAVFASPLFRAKSMVVVSLMSLSLTSVSIANAKNAVLKEGEPMPALKVSAFPGKPKFDMKKLKGKVVIVDFWASWCEPCKIELPALNALYKKYKGKGLEILGVNVDENVADANSFLKEHPVAFSLVHDKGQKMAGELGIEKMPTSLILSDGKIVKVHEAFRAGDEKKMEAEIKSLLKGE